MQEGREQASDKSLTPQNVAGSGSQRSSPEQCAPTKAKLPTKLKNKQQTLTTH
jgi:hypothetical protein